MTKLSRCAAVPLITGALVALASCDSPSQSTTEASAPVPDLQTIAATAGLQRPFELRLTGGFAHAPCEPIVPGPELVPRTACAGFPKGPTRAVSILIDAEKGNRSQIARLPFASRVRTESFIRLIKSQKLSTFDHVIEQLEEAVASMPKDALALNDLGVTYFLRAQQSQEPLYLIRALEAFDRSNNADRDLLEPLFNRARTLQLLFLRTQAELAWRNYLTVETDSSWAAEAMHHLRTLEALNGGVGRQGQMPISQSALRDAVMSNSQSARDYAEKELLPLWADSFDSHHTKVALEALDHARNIGAELAEITGERLLIESVEVIDAAVKKRDRETLRNLAEGHRALGYGYTLYRQAKTDEALMQLAKAYRLLSAGSSPAATWASYFRACSVYQAERYAESLRALLSLEQIIHGKNYFSLEAHIAWMQAQNWSVRGRQLDSLRLYRKAAAQFEVVREKENAATLRSLVGESLDYLGRHSEAWAEFYAALRLTPEIMDPKRRFIIYVNAADGLLRQRRPGVAIYFQDAVVMSALLSKNPQLQADAFFWRGLMKELAWGEGKGRGDLLTARHFVAQLADRSAQQRVEADIAMVEGSLWGSSDPVRAVESLSRSINFYKRVRLRVQAASLAYEARARAFNQLGNRRLAEADLLAAIEIAEERIRSGGRSEPRWALMESEGGVFEEMILLQVMGGNHSAGFDFAERALNHGLPSYDSGMVRPLKASEVQRSLPPRTTLVLYSIMQDRLLIWTLNSKGLNFFQVPIGRSLIIDAVDSWQRAGWRDLGEQPSLFDILVRPWIGSIQSDDLIVIVPSQDFERLPFSALLDRQTGRYLIEYRQITVAPSATLFVAASGQLASNINSDSIALVVGNPAFDRYEFPSLHSLPAAENEAGLVARFFRKSLLLTGYSADRDTFLVNLEGASLIHFAGHIVTNDSNPELSMLLLAPSRGGEGIVLARELFGRDLGRARLVVLSACRSYRQRRANGTIDMARVFLVSGASTVVSSLWEVEDSEAAQLFALFYRYLALGEKPSAALRRAQLLFLRGNIQALQKPESWASFQVVGAI